MDYDQYQQCIKILGGLHFHYCSLCDDYWQHSLFECANRGLSMTCAEHTPGGHTHDS